MSFLRWLTAGPEANLEREIAKRSLETDQRRVDAVLGPYGDNAALYSSTVALIKAANFPDVPVFGRQVASRFVLRCDELKLSPPHDAILAELIVTAEVIYAAERLTDLPPNPAEYFTHNAHVVSGQMRDLLLRQQAKALDPAATLQALSNTLVASFMALRRHLPTLALQGGIAEHVPTIPLAEVLANPGEALEEVLEPFCTPNEAGLFRLVRDELKQKVDLIAERSRSRQPPRPSEYEGPAYAMMRAFVGDTPFQGLFEARLPFEIPLDDRGEHTAIIAGSGWGKTQLLQSIVANDLNTYEAPPALIVIDSTGAMVQRIQRLAVFNEHLKDRLIIIDPEQDPVPALNMFDVSSPRLQSYDKNTREGIESEIIALFNYVFSSVENPLTARMSTAFAYMVRLLLSIPGSNIGTLRALLADNPKNGYDQAVFREHIEKLDETAQDFFKSQYYNRFADALREQIRARVFDIVKVPAFERMFSTVNKVDMFKELNEGSIILINTSESLLKEGSPTFGRYMIARVMAAAFERASIAPEKRRLAYLIVDEAAPYFDETFEKLLNRVRQFKLGVVIAFQNLEQATEKLRSTIASSTAIKYAGGTGYSDARWLAREMRVDPEFILAQKRDGSRPPQWTQFACYVRNFTDRAVSLTVPFYALENMPQMTPSEHAALLERNRQRVSSPEPAPAPEPPAVAAPPVAPAPLTLDEARTALVQAIKDKDWAKAGELQHSIIPELERQIRRPEPQPAASNADPSPPAAAAPGAPRPAATIPDIAPRSEGASDWAE